MGILVTGAGNIREEDRGPFCGDHKEFEGFRFTRLYLITVPDDPPDGRNSKDERPGLRGHRGNQRLRVDPDDVTLAGIGKSGAEVILDTGPAGLDGGLRAARGYRRSWEPPPASSTTPSPPWTCFLPRVLSGDPPTRRKLPSLATGEIAWKLSLPLPGSARSEKPGDVPKSGRPPWAPVRALRDPATARGESRSHETKSPKEQRLRDVCQD